MRKYFCLGFVLLLMISCKTSKDVIYFENLSENSDISIPENVTYEPRISVDDQLSITVTAIDPATVVPFNLPLASYPTMGEVQVYSSYQLQTYIVDSEGMINYPVFGRIKVLGMTRNELINELQKRISQYVENPIVLVQLMNFKISVLGEVNRPGPIRVTTDRITILDAISQAGDLTIYGKRTDIMIIREANGKREYKTLDITSAELFKSSYYYLKPNDVVYVAPNKPRANNAKFSQMSQYNISVISTIISAVSVIASLSIALMK